MKNVGEILKVNFMTKQQKLDDLEDRLMFKVRILINIADNMNICSEQHRQIAKCCCKEINILYNKIKKLKS